VLSIRVEYVTKSLFPHASVDVIVTVALQVPTVLATSLGTAPQLSLTVVAARAAVSAAATVG